MQLSKLGAVLPQIASKIPANYESEALVQDQMSFLDISVISLKDNKWVI
jgi:hypothetical protein